MGASLAVSRPYRRPKSDSISVIGPVAVLLVEAAGGLVGQDDVGVVATSGGSARRFGLPRRQTLDF